MADRDPMRAGRPAARETILVVEDDDEVRATVVEILSELGYRVLKAKDAAERLRDHRKRRADRPSLHRRRDAGPDAQRRAGAEAARAGCRDMRVLFTSGYTDNAIVHGGRLDEGIELSEQALQPRRTRA